MKVYIVAGMSGSGKSSALKILEDLGFYCIDNLPIDLVPKVHTTIIMLSDSLLDGHVTFLEQTECSTL